MLPDCAVKNMSTLLLLNIGNSDLLADGARPRSARPEGKALWETYEQHQFAIPIIEPCLRDLLRQQPRIGTILLFDTDQPPSGAALETDRFGVPLRDKDTVWFGRIIERYLREQFGDQIGTIKRIDLRDINPSLYDEAFDAYSRLIAQHYEAEAKVCHVLMAGGIPACNTALQLQAISAYGERCRTIYQPERGEPYELRVGSQVLATFRRATAIDALQRQDFATALALAKQVASPAIVGLISYAYYREAFDFERAQLALMQAIREAGGEVRVFLNSLRHELDDLRTRENIGALLRELLANAAITYRNERYADFLGRVFRFQEAALRYIVETKLQLPTDMSRDERPVNLPAFVQGIRDNLLLRDFVEARKVDDQPLRYDEGPNLQVMQALLDYLVLPGVRTDGTPYLNKADHGRYGEIRKRLNKFSALAQLRNQSIIAHGFAGVSLERLNEAYSGDSHHLLEDMGKVVQLLDLAAGTSPFERIAGFAAEQMRRGGAQ